MHWLPLVAMVIASALPFPHDPVSRIAAATADPSSDNRREHRHDPAAQLAAPPLDYSFDATHVDYKNMAAATAADAHNPQTNGQNLQNRKDYVKSTTSKVENRGTYQSSGNSGNKERSSVGLVAQTEVGTLRTEDIPEDNSQPKNYKADASSSRQQDSESNSMDVSNKDNLQDSTAIHRSVGAAVTQKGQRGPEPTAPSERLRGAPRVGTGIKRTPAAVTEASRTSEQGLGLEVGPDGVLEGDEMFLDAHPRVLFSPSPSPPEHPPLLLMLETGLLEEVVAREEQQEDADGHIEGHGDRAIDRSTTPSWTDASRVASEAARPVKRDKRSHLIDRRRGEKSVCESENVWIIDKKMAIDSKGDNVTVLQEIQTQTGPLKQYFFETRCRQAEQQTGGAAGGGGGRAGKSTETGLAGGGCLGVDKRQWLSECKAKQSYVRALTKDANNRTGWRWIRIDSSCVCVLLSRTNQQAGREVLMGKGKG